MSYYTELIVNSLLIKYSEGLLAKSGKVIFGMLIVATSALHTNVYADNSSTIEVAGQLDKAEYEQKAQTHRSLFQAAAEVLRKNPQAADLPECATSKQSIDVLCIRNPAIKSRSVTETSKRNG